MEQEVKKEFDSVYSRLNKEHDHIFEIETKLALLEKTVESLSNLSESFNDLNATLKSVQTALESLDERTTRIDERLSGDIRSLNQEINTQKDRGKVDILKFLSDNWFKIVTGIVTIALVVEKFIG